MTDNDLLKDIKDRFREAHDYWHEEYVTAIEDLQFTYLPGHQWPDKIRADRIRDGRPCFEVNKIPYYLDQVIGDIRQNEPAIKIVPADSNADPMTAQVLQGLIRQIEHQSDAEIAYDTAAESSVSCGFGAWRVTTEYAGDNSFDQDILIKRIKNPFTVWWGPCQDWDMGDAEYCFVTERIPIERFKKLYPNASLMPFETSKDRDLYWGNDKAIRIGEYFTREKVKKTLHLMKNAVGNLFTTFERPDMERLSSLGWTLARERQVESYEVKWCKANQSEILEKQVVWPGRYIPIVPLFGKEITVEGRTYYRGMVRYGRESQRIYNMARSAAIETVALAPKAPYLVTAKQISNYQSKWDTAHKRNYPYLPYDVDPDNPQAIPKRTDPIGVNTAFRDEMITADQELHDTVGLQQASLGQKSNEQSGRAILARQKEGDTAQYVYYDNLGRAMKRTAKILIDLIPKIYDTARIIRVMGDDMKAQMVPVNQPIMQQGPNGESIQRIYDLTVGKYDAMITIGPSFTTQRQEAAANMMKFIEAVPEAGVLIGDLLARNLDWPGADEIERRLKTLLPPQLQQGGKPDIESILSQKESAARVIGMELENRQKFEDMKTGAQQNMLPTASE